MPCTVRLRTRIYLLKGTVAREKFSNYSIGCKGCFGLLILFLSYSFNLLRIFKVGVKRNKTAFPCRPCRVENLLMSPTPPPLLPTWWHCDTIAVPPKVVSGWVRKLICMRVGDLRKLEYAKFASDPGLIRKLTIGDELVDSRILYYKWQTSETTTCGGSGTMAQHDELCFTTNGAIKHSVRSKFPNS